MYNKYGKCIEYTLTPNTVFLLHTIVFLSVYDYLQWTLSNFNIKKTHFRKRFVLHIYIYIYNMLND